MKIAAKTVAFCVLVAFVAPAQTGPITDPAAFVTEVYRRFAASEHGHDYSPPEGIYSPRLAALFAEDDRRRHGEVGCIEFEFWVNGQDYALKNVKVASRDVAGHPDQRLVIATFANLGTPEEIHFTFQKVGGRWLLDEAQSVKSERWTLSAILKCWK